VALVPSEPGGDTPEHRERLVLRGGREGEEAQVRLPAALGHAAELLLEIFAAFLGGTLLRLVAERLAAEHLFQVRRGFAALGAVRLVDDDRASVASEPLASIHLQRSVRICSPVFGPCSASSFAHSLGCVSLMKSRATDGKMARSRSKPSREMAT
jgi:hypothetical protein